MRQINNHADAVHLADQSATLGADAVPDWFGYAEGVFPERGVGEAVAAVVREGGVADAQGVVLAEDGGAVADLVEAFYAQGGDEWAEGVVSVVMVLMGMLRVVVVRADIVVVVVVVVFWVVVLLIVELVGKRVLELVMLAEAVQGFAAGQSRWRENRGMRRAEPGEDVNLLERALDG